jgi:hypothetical protein
MSKEALTKRTLIDIGQDMEALDDMLAESGGDISDPAVSQAVDQFFSEIESDLENKVAGYIGLIRRNELYAAAAKEEIDRLRKRQCVLENAARNLKDRLKWFMEWRGTKKIETPRGVASVAGNGGKQPVDVHVPAEELPERFRKIKVEPDTDAIRKALVAGEEIPGCVLQERGFHLRIR